MCEKGNKSVDIHIHGLESIGEAANTLAKGAVNFLSKICSPFAEEYGLYLQDKVKNWQVNNFAKIARKAERKLEESGGIGEKSAHPRIVFQVFEHGSWIEDDNVQEMWARLLASSCTETGKDDSNLIFTNLLPQLTTSEARILNYSCEHTEKELTQTGWIRNKY